MSPPRHSFPGLAGKNLLGWPWRPPPPWPRLQRDGCSLRGRSTDRHWPRSSRFRVSPSPNRETEALMDGSDAVSGWPLLGEYPRLRFKATWVSLHHRGSVAQGLLHNVRHGDRMRRHRSFRSAMAQVCAERSGYRRHAPRRRGLSLGDRDCQGQRARSPKPRRLSALSARQFAAVPGTFQGVRWAPAGRLSPSRPSTKAA